MPRKLMYSRKRYNKKIVGSYILDLRIYGKESYQPSITPIVRALFREELHAASRRIYVTNEGRYSYTPSQEYLTAYKKLGLNVGSREKK